MPIRNQIFFITGSVFPNQVEGMSDSLINKLTMQEGKPAQILRIRNVLRVRALGEKVSFLSSVPGVNFICQYESAKVIYLSVNSFSTQQQNNNSKGCSIHCTLFVLCAVASCRLQVSQYCCHTMSSLSTLTT